MLAILTCVILYASVWSVEKTIEVNHVVNKVDVNLYHEDDHKFIVKVLSEY